MMIFRYRYIELKQTVTIRFLVILVIEFWTMQLAIQMWVILIIHLLDGANQSANYQNWKILVIHFWMINTIIQFCMT